jgi:signal transduction histidine kinase
MPYSLYPLSGLINGIMAVGLGLFVYTRDPSDRRYITYGLFCLSLCFWSFAYFFWLSSNNAADALFWARTLMAGAVFIPVTAYHHVTQLLGVSTKVKSRLISLGYFCSALLMLSTPTEFMVRSVSKKLDFDYWPNPGPAFHFHLMMWLVFACGSILELYRGYRDSTGRRRIHSKILLATITVAYIGGGTNYYLWYDIPILPLGNIAISIYIGVFAYAILAYRLLDIEVIFKKSLIYALLLAALLVPCFLVIVWGQKLAFDTINYTFSMATLLLFIIIGFLFPKIRFRTEEALERVLFQKRVDYRETLLRSSKEMVSIVDLENLSNSLVKTVSRALGTEVASLYLLEETKGVYNLKAKIGQERNGQPLTMLPKSDPLIERLTGNQEGVVKEELEMAQDKLFGLQVAKKMGELEAEISVPIMSKGKLIGILNLGHKEGKEIYSSEDLELLSTLANQAAIALENARLYENLKQSQDTLRRADRLSSLGLLTAGLAHEIRNPLVAIRTFTQLLPERYNDAEFREGFQGLALKEVDRICGLINDLLSFARPSRPNVAEENMNDVVDGIARILETEAKEKGVEIARDFGLNLPKVWIDREQMKQVFMNLILNAIQAMREGGSIFISTRLISRDEAGHPGQFVQVEVRDTGIGIPAENLDHIFDPFFTSKDEGSGLGLSISHQIVQEHGGYVTVESKVGVGTTFFINLPTGKPIRQLSNGRAHASEANLSH